MDSAFYNMEIEPKQYHEQHEEEEHHDGIDTNHSFEAFGAAQVQTKEKKACRQSKCAVQNLSLPMPLPTFRPEQAGSMQARINK